MYFSKAGCIYIMFLSFLVYLHKYVYAAGDELLLKFNKTKPDLVLTPFKKKYIIKNIWKSAVLLLILISGSIAVFDGFFNNVWSNLTFFVWGTVYVSLDLSGLIFVRGLPTATKIHHSIVIVLGSLNAITDYYEPGYYRSILIYTYFSIVPFIVNFYLAYRYLECNQIKKKTVAKISSIIYAVSLGTNVLCNLIFFATEPFSWTIVFYFASYSLIMNDDIKLIRFLLDESLYT